MPLPVPSALSCMRPNAGAPQRGHGLAPAVQRLRFVGEVVVLAFRQVVVIVAHVDAQLFESRGEIEGYCPAFGGHAWGESSGQGEDAVGAVEIERELFPVGQGKSRAVIVPADERVRRARRRVVVQHDVLERRARSAAHGEHLVRGDEVEHTRGLHRRNGRERARTKVGVRNLS